MLVALQNDCCAATAGHEAVASGIEWAAGLLGLALADGECLNAIEGSNAIHVVLLSSAADHTFLQALGNEHCTQADALRTGSAGSRRCEVDAAQLEEAGQVHRDIGVHTLEDGTTAASHGAVCLTELVEALHGGFCYGIIAIDDAHLVRSEEVLIDAGIVKSLLGGYVAVLCLFGHKVAEVAGDVWLQIHLGNIAHEG